MGKTQAVEKGEADFLRLFRETLAAANKNSPEPGAVQRFEETLEVCREHGVMPWQGRSPVWDVTAFILIKDTAMLPKGIAALWVEHARDLRAALGHKTAPALEQALIDHACVCWLRLAAMEVRYSCIVNANNTLVQVEHAEKRLTEAQKRFNRACESLARVRRLSAPKVQINVATEGGRQLNVA
jgi:hypothetical protein